jgi:hypothetical protein
MSSDDLLYELIRQEFETISQVLSQIRSLEIDELNMTGINLYQQEINEVKQNNQRIRNYLNLIIQPNKVSTTHKVLDTILEKLDKLEILVISRRKQLEEKSIYINGVNIPIVDLNEVSSTIGQINSFRIKPLLQKYVQRTSNSIVTLMTNEGRIYYVKAIYIAGTNMLYPPI